MKTEEKDRVYQVYEKLSAGRVELGRVISALEKEGVDVEALKKARATIHEGIGTILYSLEATEERRKEE